MEHIQTKINLEMRRGGFLAVSKDNVTIERGKIFTQTTSFQHSMLETRSNSHTALRECSGGHGVDLLHLTQF